ncbi:hypothetical protein [uncultured Tenacibaculum sp.]|uniref:hypothetical protein n=1 Tax=uncultured Tenacibaculum sp. TaxID=174713 RepID=UPI0026301E19|nr:hypothetical protein [uncultured Tenacibaculum sp.]
MIKKYYVIIGFLFIISFSSCSSSEDTNHLDSKFTLNDTEYSTPNGHLITLVNNPTSSTQALFNVLYLLDGKILNNEFKGDGCDYSNNVTSGVIIGLVTGYEEEFFLPSGTYNYGESNSSSYIAPSFIITDVVVENNCTVSSNSIGQQQIINGVVNVERSDNIFTINYTFETRDFGNIQGKYVGPLQQVERI